MTLLPFGPFLSPALCCSWSEGVCVYTCVYMWTSTCVQDFTRWPFVLGRKERPGGQSGIPPPLHIQTVKGFSLQYRALDPARLSAAGLPELPL